MQKIVVHQASLPVVSRAARAATDRFPINRVFCVGRNYREHAVEMGGDPDREPPFFFLKPSCAVVDTHAKDAAHCGTLDRRVHCVVPYPPATSDLHHEGELVVCVGKGGSGISVEEAEDHVYGYAVGCDLTRRDVQAEAKRARRPWDAAKAFDFSAPCGPVVPRDEAGIGPGTKLTLEVNGDLRQTTTLDRMVWNVPETLAHLSRLFRLMPGDLVMTGTPAGVDAVVEGDFVKISCGSLPPCEFYIGPPEK